MKKSADFWVFVLACLVMLSCGSEQSGTGYVTIGMNATGLSSILLTRSAQTIGTNSTKETSCPTTTPTHDTTSYAAGLDCDDDGGVIRYISPSTFKIAIKKLTLRKEEHS